jgi:hypothetical protein
MRVILIIGLVFSILACNKSSPSSFWSKYENDKLKEDFSNQGPYGGKTVLYWKAELRNTFNVNDVLSFAKKNDWVIVGSIRVKVDDLATWNFNSRPIFPLSYHGFSVKADNDATYKHFPRWINTEQKIYMFKTGWLMIEPGTDQSNDINGFVVINDKGNEMSVYHLWGE